MLLSVAEGAPHLAGDEESVREFAKKSQLHFIRHVIGEQSAGDAVVRLVAEAVAVFPVGEWTCGLLVTEVLVPREFTDDGVPRLADGRKRQGAKADAHGCADAGNG